MALYTVQRVVHARTARDLFSVPEAFGYLSSDKCISRPDSVERFSVNSEAATGPLDPARGSAPMINRSRLAPPPHRANTFRLHACTFPLEWETLARSQNDFAQIDKRERGKEWLDR